MTPNPETVARYFHEAYERLAPSFGYETRQDTAVPWDDVPEPNRSLMVAVAALVLARIVGAERVTLGGHDAQKHRDADSIAFVAGCDECERERRAPLAVADWCDAYADDLERGGWSQDAARYRRHARRLRIHDS